MNAAETERLNADLHLVTISLVLKALIEKLFALGILDAPDLADIRAYVTQFAIDLADRMHPSPRPENVDLEQAISLWWDRINVP